MHATPQARPAIHHSVIDDAQALVAGTLLISLGVALLGKAGLITGGTVGIAFLLHYASGISFGKLFFLVNLPFYALALKKMGKTFTLKTFGAVLLLCVWSELLPLVLKIDNINPVYASLIGGLLTGVGLVILFRHNASLGGVNVLVLYLQGRYGWRAGYLQLGIDSAITLLSIPLISYQAIGISLLGALVLNLTIAINHQPGRYVAI